MFTKAQVSTPNNFLLVTNVLLNYYYMRIDPLEWKSHNNNLNAVELKEQGTDWFLGLAWYKRQFMGISKPFFCSHWHTYRYFCILYSKLSWSANPFLFAPFHFTIWMTHLFDVKHTTWEEKGKKKSLSKRENMRGILNSVIQNMFYTCTYCMKLLPHLLLLLLYLILLVSILNSVSLAYFLLMTYLTWLKYLSWLKTILCVLENYLYLKVVLRKWKTWACVFTSSLMYFMREKTSGKKILILISTLS